MPAHPLTNFEIQKCQQNELKFNEAYPRIKLPDKKDGDYVTNLDDF